MCGGARHELNVCRGQKRQNVNSKDKGLVFWAWLIGGADLLILLMYFLFSDF